MKREKVVLSFIGVAIGLIFAGLAFYFYQSSKAIDTDQNTNKAASAPTPTPKTSFYLVINEPIDEQVIANKVITLSGQTTPDATILIITKSAQEVLKPTQMGSFTTTLTLEDGENLIRLVAFASNGETTMAQRVITFSTKDF
ncbi:MAG: hypothetical protein A2W22_02240 [Candidatus Levybacteria bacterium RBG_16_35_11]|nr:MAG: hypothetical protein A2W22_02240 [Candidatus Levybacteria bacterium RBG_16_35_11]